MTRKHKLSRSTPLHVAARGGHKDVVRYLAFTVKMFIFMFKKNYKSYCMCKCTVYIQVYRCVTCTTCIQCSTCNSESCKFSNKI